MSLRRRLYFEELLKRRKIIKKTVGLPKKHFLQKREGIPFRLSPKAKNFLILFALTGIFIGAVYFFFFSEAIRVKQIVFFHGNEKVIVTPFQFDSTKFLGKHMFFLPTSEFRKQIFQQYEKEVKSFVISRKVPSKLVIRYETFPAVANIVVNKDGLERKFLMNEFGLIIEMDSELPDLPVIRGPFENFPKLREIVIDQAHLKSMTRAYQLFTEKFGLKVPIVLYKKVEREVHLKTEKDFWVWLNLTQEIERQLFKLKRSLSKLDIYHESLQYIDLRISGKTGEKVIFKKR